MMPVEVRKEMIRSVKSFMAKAKAPVEISDLAHNLGKSNPALKNLSEDDFRSVVQPMVATGLLNFVDGFKVELNRAGQ